MDKLQISWQLGIGQAGVDSDEQNPYRRSVKRLFATGRPFSRIALSFLRESDGPVHWLGVFVQGKRTMFFPGFAERFDGAETSQGAKLPTNQSFHFDHISLENDKRSWHVTAEDSAEHISATQTLDLGDGRVLWFGLSFSSLSAFRPVYATTSIEFETPKRDSQRRLEAFRAARHGADFPIISFNDDHPNPFAESFFHVAVVAGPPGFPLYSGPELAFPYNNPYVSPMLPLELTGLPVRVHRLTLSPETELQITATRLPGSLSIPVIFTGSPKPIAISGGIV